jgi:hypothetical protein
MPRRTEDGFTVILRSLRDESLKLGGACDEERRRGVEKQGHKAVDSLFFVRGDAEQS